MSNHTFNYTAGTCKDLTVDPSYIGLTVVLFVISSLALITHVFFSVLLWRTEAFHSNVRLLLQNFSLSGCSLSLLSIGRCVYNFVLIGKGFDYGAVSVLRCEWIETVFNASEGSLTLSMACIGMDRLISTLRRTHVDPERPTAVAYVQVAVCWVAGTVFHLVSILVSSREHENRLECYCQTTLVTPMSILYYMVVGFFLTELSTAICYVLLYRYSLRSFTNFTINTAQHSLSERHQMMSNVKTSILLCPSIVLHGCVYALISLSLVPVRILIDGNTYENHVCYALLILVIMELEMVTQAVLLITRKDTLRKAALNLLGPVLERLGLVGRVNAPTVGGSTAEPANHRGAEMQRHKMATIPSIHTVVGSSNACTKPRAAAKHVAGQGRLVEFRIKPEDNVHIMNALWEKSAPTAGKAATAGGPGPRGSKSWQP